MAERHDCLGFGSILAFWCAKSLTLRVSDELSDLTPMRLVNFSD